MAGCSEKVSNSFPISATEKIQKAQDIQLTVSLKALLKEDLKKISKRLVEDVNQIVNVHLYQFLDAKYSSEDLFLALIQNSLDPIVC